MPDTTTNYGWAFGVLTDNTVDLLDISPLAAAVDAQVAMTTTIGVPAGASVSLDPSAWTELCSVTITLPTAQPVEIVGWARVLNTGSTRPILALQVLDGSTHLFGTGQIDVAGTGDSYGADVVLNTPRRRVGLTAGSHTLHLQAWKDSNGTLAAKKTSTFGSQDIAVTGIEVSY